MLTEENLNHWITSKASEEITRIKNHEVQQNKYDPCFSPIDKRYNPKHNGISKGFKHPGTLEGFEKWYKGRLHSIHPLSPETLDKIAESNFN